MIYWRHASVSVFPNMSSIWQNDCDGQGMHGGGLHHDIPDDIHEELLKRAKWVQKTDKKQKRCPT